MINAFTFEASDAKASVTALSEQLAVPLMLTVMS